MPDRRLASHPDLPDLTWIIPGELALMREPGSSVGWAREIAALLAVGIRRVISLTERPLGVGMGRLPFRRVDHLPLKDFSTPDQELLERAVKLIDEALAAGEPVLVHCYMGLGRSGTIAAVYLVHRGATPAEALRRVRSLRPGAVETSGQEDAVIEFWARQQDAAPDPASRPPVS